MIIIPIAGTNINWDIFVQACNTNLGRSPTRSLDSSNLSVGPIDSFFAALDEFHLKDANPRENSEFTLYHVSITFLMVLDRWIYYSLLEKSFKNIHIIKSLDNQEERYQITIIATATIKDWKDSIINGPLEWSKEMWDLFHKINLGKVFQNYKINQHNVIERR